MRFPKEKYLGNWKREGRSSHYQVTLEEGEREGLKKNKEEKICIFLHSHILSQNRFPRKNGRGKGIAPHFFLGKQGRDLEKNLQGERGI